MDKIEQKLDSRMKGSKSESGERARLSEHGKSLAERLREERASGELARKSEARINEIVDDPHKGSQSRPLDIKGLLERNRELDRQSTNTDSDSAVRHNRESDPRRAEAMEHGKPSVAGFLDRLNKERASGELARKSEAHVKKQVDGMHLDHVHVEGMMERQRIMDQRKV